MSERYADEVAFAILEVVLDEYKPRLRRLIREDFFYKAPEALRHDPECWLKLSHEVNQILPEPNELKEDWQIKTVALLIDKSEDFVRKSIKQL